ncbi:MAG TPA: response regulator transcription factor, partial [bacterium]
LQAFLDIQTNLTCIHTTETVERLMELLQEEDLPDIILMDVRLPGMSGIRGIDLIKQRHPQIDIVVLTVYNDSDKIFDALCAGASGYLLKNAPFSEIKGSLELLHDGGAPMSPPIARKVIEFFHAKNKPTKPGPLSPREREVVNALVDGLSYKMVADRLGISIGTMCSHIKNIYRKLHVHSKAEVISRSLRGEI